MTVEPVAVSPEMVSNTASTNDSPNWEKHEGQGGDHGGEGSHVADTARVTSRPPMLWRLRWQARARLRPVKIEIAGEVRKTA